jgi:hypothetical protein
MTQKREGRRADSEFGLAQRVANGASPGLSRRVVAAQLVRRRERLTTIPTSLTGRFNIAAQRPARGRKTFPWAPERRSAVTRDSIATAGGFALDALGGEDENPRAGPRPGLLLRLRRPWLGEAARLIGLNLPVPRARQHRLGHRGGAEAGRLGDRPRHRPAHAQAEAQRSRC